jgi:hypothetical protein
MIGRYLLQLTFAVFSFASLAMSDVELGNYLTSIHDVSWKELQQKYNAGVSDPKSFKDKIKSIINNPKEELPQLDSLQNRLAWENAIRGYGHLVSTNSLGNLISSEQIFYKNLQNKLSKYEDEFGKIAYIESLKNTGTSDALGMLGDFAQEDNSTWLSMKALDAASRILEGETSFENVGDLAYIPFYYPNLEEKFYLRESADWASHIEELLTIEEKIKALYNFKNTQEVHPSMETYFTDLEEKFMKSLNQAKVALNNPKGHDQAQAPILLADMAGEANEGKDFGTLGQTIGKFSEEEANTKSELAQNLEEKRNNENSQTAKRGIASENDNNMNDSNVAPSPHNFMLYGMIAILFIIMGFVGIKFSKKKNK